MTPIQGALLLQGLAALLVQGLSGSSPEQIARLDPTWVAELSPQLSLTPSRTNGFLNMFRTMQSKSLALLVAQVSASCFWCHCRMCGICVCLLGANQKWDMRGVHCQELRSGHQRLSQHVPHHAEQEPGPAGLPGQPLQDCQCDQHTGGAV